MGRLESTARSLATPTKTTSTVVVKGLTANQAKTLEAKASAQDATQVKALLDTAIKADTSLPEMAVSGVKTITTKSEQVTEQTNQKISIPMKYNVDSAASCKLIQDSTKFHESIKKSTASWTEGSTADCTAVTSCPAARRLAADGRRLAKVAVTTTSTQSGLTELQAKKGKVVVEGMAATKIEAALTTAKGTDTKLNAVVISDVKQVTTKVEQSATSSSTGASLALSVLMMCALALATQLP